LWLWVKLPSGLTARGFDLQAYAKRGDNKRECRKVLEEKAPLIDKAIEKYIPRQFQQRRGSLQVTPAHVQLHHRTMDKAIARTIWDMLDRGGKRGDQRCFCSSVKPLVKTADYCLDFSVIPEVIHNGTLVIETSRLI
jgi:hypothetical protein